MRIWRDRTPHGKGRIAILSAGTSDLFVAEEARVTAEIMGNETDLIQDVGRRRTSPSPQASKSAWPESASPSYALVWKARCPAS